VVLRKINIRTVIYPKSDFNHLWLAQIDIIYLAMYGIPQINKSQKGFNGVNYP
jgi:hypothetical protein